MKFTIKLPPEGLAVEADDEAGAAFKLARAVGKIADGHPWHDEEYDELGIPAKSIEIEAAKSSRKKAAN